VFRAQLTEDLRHVAIVDDVVTTGSTVRELARALSRQGVQDVEVWAVARATLRP
jgi:predicted amidophosphoribosyltransferase